MTAKEECRRLCRGIVLFRDMFCQMCGKAQELHYFETHHIWLRSQEIWIVQYDPDFMVTLDFDCHQIKEKAPHQNNELFIANIIPKIASKDEKRAAKILKFLNSPEDSDEARASRMCPPNYREIAKRLKVQFAEAQETYEMNKYNCDEIYRGNYQI